MFNPDEIFNLFDGDFNRHDVFGNNFNKHQKDVAKHSPIAAQCLSRGCRTGAMRVDISEKDGFVSIKADLPGFNKEEIEINLVGDTLTVSAVRNEKTEEANGEKKFVSERHVRYGRSFSVPENRTPEDFKVKYDNGVLTITYEKEKEEEKKNTRIQID